MNINKLIKEEVKKVLKESKNKSNEPVDYEKKIIDSISKMRKSVLDLKQTFVDYGLDSKSEECEKLEDIYEILLNYEPVRKKISTKIKSLKQVKEMGEYKSFKPKKHMYEEEEDLSFKVNAKKINDDPNLLKDVGKMSKDNEIDIELT